MEAGGTYRQADKQTDIRTYAGTDRYVVRQRENRTDTEAVKQRGNQAYKSRDQRDRGKDRYTST